MKHRIAATVILMSTIGCWGTVDIAKHEKTIEMLIEIGTVLSACKQTRGEYPPSVEIELEKLSGELLHCEPRALLFNDLWGNPLKYASNGTHFVLWSQGPDNQPDISSQGGPIAEMDIDIVLSDGGLWQYLMGLGTQSKHATRNPFVDLDPLLHKNAGSAVADPA